MTIREVLQRKTWRIILFGIASWLAIIVSLFFAREGLRILTIVPFLAFMAAALAQIFFVRCPRCNGNLGLIVAQTLAPGRFKTHVSNCPYCGVSFDHTA